MGVCPAHLNDTIREPLDISGATGIDTYDVSVESSLVAVKATGALAEAVTITKAAAGTTVALTATSSTDTTVADFTYALKTATGTSDVFTLSLNAKDTDKDGVVDGKETVSLLTAASIETIAVSSNATTTETGKTAGSYVNTISSLVADSVKTLTLTGAADLTISDVTATTLTKVDASGMTGGQLNITLDAGANASAVAILGTTKADTIILTANVAENNIIVGNGGADAITLEAGGGTKETVRYATDTDSVLTLTDTTDPVVTPVVMDTATGYDVLTNFTSLEDKIELSSVLGLGSSDARTAIAGKGVIADVTAAADLQTLIGTGVGFFNDGAANRAIATVNDGTNMMVFIDTDADGNFTNGTDQAIELVGLTALVITDFVFG